MSTTKPTLRKTFDFRGGPDCVVWEITLRCNLRCLHCGANAAEERERELTTEECLQICEQLHAIKAKVITLMGGEFLLRRDWVQIAQRIDELGMKLTVVSNAFNMTDQVLDQLQQLNLWHIVYSLDGASPETHDAIRGVPGSHARVLDAIERTVARGLPAGIITTVQRRNLYELFGVRDLVRRYDGKLRWQLQVASCHGGRMTAEDCLTPLEFYFVGAFLNQTMRSFSFESCPIMGAHDLGYFSDHLDKVAEINRAAWGGCTAGVNTLGINSAGSVKGCLSLPDAFIEGSLRSRPLAEIWNDPQGFVCNRNFEESRLQGFCAACPHRLSCEGGCSDLACSRSGSPYDAPLCFYRIEQTAGAEKQSPKKRKKRLQ